MNGSPLHASKDCAQKTNLQSGAKLILESASRSTHVCGEPVMAHLVKKYV